MRFYYFLLIALLGIPSLGMTADFQNGGFENGTFNQDWDCGDGNPVSGVSNLSSHWGPDNSATMTGWVGGFISPPAGIGPDWSRGDCASTDRTGDFALNMTPLAGYFGYVAQSFDTFPGVTYQVGFWVMSWSQAPWGYALPDVNISTTATVRDGSQAGATLATLDGGPDTAGVWKNYTFTFVATSGTTNLEFKNTAAGGSISTMLDDVSVTPLTPGLTVTGRPYVYDPTALNLKALPEQNIVYEWGVTNASISPDASTLEYAVDVPSPAAFKIGSLVFEDGARLSTTGGNPATNGTAITATGLTCCGGGGQVLYSSDGVTFGYTPSTDSSDGNGNYDSQVRKIKIVPSGTMTTGTPSNPVGFRFYFQAHIP